MTLSYYFTKIDLRLCKTGWPKAISSCSSHLDLDWLQEVIQLQICIHLFFFLRVSFQFVVYELVCCRDKQTCTQKLNQGQKHYHPLAFGWRWYNFGPQKTFLAPLVNVSENKHKSLSELLLRYVQPMQEKPFAWLWFMWAGTRKQHQTKNVFDRICMAVPLFVCAQTVSVVL